MNRVIRISSVTRGRKGSWETRLIEKLELRIVDYSRNLSYSGQVIRLIRFRSVIAHHEFREYTRTTFHQHAKNLKRNVKKKSKK